MQEYVQERTVVLTFRAARLTARGLAKALRSVLRMAAAHRSSGKMPVKRLVRQGKGVSSIDITEKNIRPFQRIAKKYGISFGIRRDKTDSPARWLVFFQTRDADALTAAFKEFTDKMLNHRRPSVLEKLRAFQAVVQKVGQRAHVRQKKREKVR